MDTGVFQLIFCITLILISTVNFMYYRTIGKTIDSTGNSNVFSDIYINYREFTIVVSTVIVCTAVLLVPKPFMTLFSLK